MGGRLSLCLLATTRDDAVLLLFKSPWYQNLGVCYLHKKLIYAWTYNEREREAQICRIITFDSVQKTKYRRSEWRLITWISWHVNGRPLIRSLSLSSMLFHRHIFLISARVFRHLCSMNLRGKKPIATFSTRFYDYTWTKTQTNRKIWSFVWHRECQSFLNTVSALAVLFFLILFIFFHHVLRDSNNFWIPLAKFCNRFFYLSRAPSNSHGIYTESSIPSN